MRGKLCAESDTSVWLAVLTAWKVTERVGGLLQRLRRSGHVWRLVSVSRLKMITVKTHSPISDHLTAYESVSPASLVLSLFLSGEAQLRLQVSNLQHDITER